MISQYFTFGVRFRFKPSKPLKCTVLLEQNIWEAPLPCFVKPCARFKGNHQHRTPAVWEPAAFPEVRRHPAPAQLADLRGSEVDRTGSGGLCLCAGPRRSAGGLQRWVVETNAETNAPGWPQTEDTEFPRGTGTTESMVWWATCQFLVVTVKECEHIF